MIPTRWLMNSFAELATTRRRTTVGRRTHVPANDDASEADFVFASVQSNLSRRHHCLLKIAFLSE